MVAFILIKKTKENKCSKYYIHDEHEFDMIDLLLENQNKINQLHEELIGLDWFIIKPTEKDKESYYNTCWFRNSRSLNDTSLQDRIRKDIEECNEIETFFINYWRRNKIRI